MIKNTEELAKKTLDSLQNVSRETFLRLEQYRDLLLRWNKAINLISNFTEKNLWQRHILDCAQLFNYLDPTLPIVDVGSGGGLPGIVLSILGVKHITLVESDRRKAIFLQEAAKISANSLIILNQNFEKTDLSNIMLVTARAFCKIEKLLTLTKDRLNERAVILLLKGKTWDEEVAEAKQRWQFDYQFFPSITDQEAVVIKIYNVKKND